VDRRTLDIRGTCSNVFSRFNTDIAHDRQTDCTFIVIACTVLGMDIIVQYKTCWNCDEYQSVCATIR